jgi:hypothetical protein
MLGPVPPRVGGGHQATPVPIELWYGNGNGTETDQGRRDNRPEAFMRMQHLDDVAGILIALASSVSCRTVVSELVTLVMVVAFATIDIDHDERQRQLGARGAAIGPTARDRICGGSASQ